MKLAAFLLGDIAEMLAVVTAAWTLGAPASFPQLSKTRMAGNISFNAFFFIFIQLS